MLLKITTTGRMETEETVPLFEFKCPKCEVVSEVNLKADDKTTACVKCPKCGIRMALVPFSKPAQFRWGRGGGWN